MVFAMKNSITGEINTKSMLTIFIHLLKAFFIIHTYVMKILEKLIGFSFTGAYLLFPIFTFVVSFLAVGILMKIPYFNRIVKL